MLDRAAGLVKTIAHPLHRVLNMSTVPNQPSSPTSTPCKHPKVKVVAREEDAEYVECTDCGEVFESSEFRDMQIEETVAEEAEE